MKHDARAVANRLLDLVAEDGNRLTAMQVVKLTYFCHAWMLGLYRRPLIEQPVEAWRYGPIINDVYQSFRKYRHDPIKSRARAAAADFDDEEEYIIGQVYQKYGYLTGIRLSQLAHGPGTPWEQVREMNRDTSIIPNWMMEQFYVQQAEAYAAKQSA